MFSILFSFFGKWFDEAIRFLQLSGGFISYLVSSGFGVLLSVMLWATTVLHWVSRCLYYIANYIDQMRISSDVATGLANTTSIIDLLEIMNTFFPLVEVFSISIALGSLALVCAMYGFIKSWIPTLSG